MNQAMPTGPIYSEDGHWWWDGQQWRPVEAPPAATAVQQQTLGPRSRRPPIPVIAGGLVALLGLAILASALFGFNPFAGGAGADRPTGPDLLTPEQASAFTSTFWTAYSTAASKHDQASLKAMFTGPALQAVKANGTIVPGGPVSHVTVAVPHQPHYPILFMAEVTVQIYDLQGQPIGGANYDLILTRHDAASPWQSPLLFAYLPLPTLRSDGFAESPLSAAHEAGLAENPASLPSAYARSLNALQVGRPGVGVFSNLSQPFWASSPGFNIAVQFDPDSSGILARSRTALGGESIIFVLNGTLTATTGTGACIDTRKIVAGLRGAFFTGARPGLYRKVDLPLQLYVDLEVPPSGTLLGNFTPIPNYYPSKPTPC